MKIQNQKTKFSDFFFDGKVNPGFNEEQFKTTKRSSNGGYIMNKAELIEKVASETGMTKADTERVLDATLNNIKKTVKKGNDVKLVGFGTFLKAKRKARTGRNPQTGKTIKIPASSFPKFRPGAEFKSMLR